MEPADIPTWNLFVDGLSREIGSRANIVLFSLEGHKLNYVVRFGFKATNNVVEYEAPLADLRLAREMEVKRPYIGCDSQLMVSQVNGSFTVKEKSMPAYLKQVTEFLFTFDKFELVQIPRSENFHTDALPKQASSNDSALILVNV